MYTCIYIYICGLCRYSIVVRRLDRPPEQPPGNRFKNFNGRLVESKKEKEEVEASAALQIDVADDDTSIIRLLPLMINEAALQVHHGQRLGSTIRRAFRET